MHAQQLEIGLDALHHGSDGELAERRQPFALRRVAIALAVALRQRLAHRPEIVAGIEPFRDLADILAQRLAVAQPGRAGENVDLRSGVVDVVLARDVEADLLEQRRQHVAIDRAARMGDVQRTRRVGGNVLDVDLPAATSVRAAVGAARHQRVGQPCPPESVAQAQVDEAGPGDRNLGDVRMRAQFAHQHVGDLARLAPGLLAQHQRRIGREISVRGIARRLDRDGGGVERRQGAGPGQPLECRGDLGGEKLEGIHVGGCFYS